MQRRSFLKSGSLAAVGLGVLSSSSCSIIVEESKQSQAAKSALDFELNEVTIQMLQSSMVDKLRSARSIAEQYLKRIAEVDKKGPQLNAVIELNPDALAIADEMDKERAAGKVRGPMHGIPVLIKDNIDTADKMHTTAGALALADNIASQDAHIVKRLRAAGAVILGKTNLSEWANFRSSDSTSGWSSRGGQTKNPYILNRNPSGSSAGSGSAVAANLCAIAIGTETDGSIVSPSSVCGGVGFKPTVGLWSRSGIIPISKTQDTAGPMARNVSDAAILLGALAGEDPRDPYTKESRGKGLEDYTRFLDAEGLKGKRLGVEKSALTAGNLAAQALLKEALDLMRSKGATIVEIELLKPLRVIGNAEFTVLLYEFKAGVNDYLSHANSAMKNLADVIAFNKQNESKAMPFFKQETLELAQSKGGLDQAEYTEALKKSSLETRKIIDDIMDKNRLDAVVGPTNGFAVCIDLVNGDYGNGFSFSSPAAKAGYPHITVPMGAWHDLPMGISFFGKAFTEPELIRIAYAYEQASRKRKAPSFNPALFG
ncbi:amidase [Pedobacter quisquiliarum]|uniref:Amidase n=1 Tax=Pedobacter quisquiliarum TaxID=1834438 RepID=A0A916X9E7_9SPHI|nr:amidase [Pedobacter quisquiliarum]GGC53297.1 amidase [Pedobacter quisquiliarum]